MKRISLLFIVFVALLSCNGLSETELVEKIDKLELEIKESNQLEAEKIEELIELYDALIPKKGKENQPSLMEKKAKYYASLGQHEKALNVYESIYDKFPKYEKRGETLFMQAFIVEVNFNDLKKAEDLYKKYLDEFPNGDFAKDAEFSLENLYLSPEELIRKFKEAEQSTETTENKVVS